MSLRTAALRLLNELWPASSALAGDLVGACLGVGMGTPAPCFCTAYTKRLWCMRLDCQAKLADPASAGTPKHGQLWDDRARRYIQL